MLSIPHLLLLLLVILIVFGAGRLPKVMQDLGKGIKNFRQSLNENDSNEGSLVEKSEKDKLHHDADKPSS